MRDLSPFTLVWVPREQLGMAKGAAVHSVFGQARRECLGLCNPLWKLHRFPLLGLGGHP